MKNDCYLSLLRQGYKWYEYPLDGKSQPTILSKISVVQCQLYVDIANDESKISKHICSQILDRSLRKNDTFLLDNYDHDIMVDEIISKNIIEYNKQLLEHSEQDIG